MESLLEKAGFGAVQPASIRGVSNAPRPQKEEVPRRRDWPNGSHHIMRIATEEEPDDRQDAAARSPAAKFGKLWVGLLGRRH